MFTKILIANRGEIACRVAATARRLGIKTVAVYSEADASARHVAVCDEAVLIGPAAAKESYLRGDKIIAAAKATGAQAIHPGYGFLSENAEFADACAEAGLVFIGPPASAMRAMGSKSAAKQLMEKANVPLVPGYHGEQQDADFLHGEADRIGYPVLLKASAGGGGKGMRVVENSAQFKDALASCKREAISSFGDDKVLAEKYLQRPRHIEIQVFADTLGNCIYLFERDCSVQRRHQKVLEEAPAPGMTDERRAAMGEAAVAAARAVGYVGAGTVEFIANQDGTFYFMEMNTRLQVEHPVTEMITGTDLVEWQLRVAAGEPLPKQQHELTINGHAIEARIYAENPEKGFLPSIGTLRHLGTPAAVSFELGGAATAIGGAGAATHGAAPAAVRIDSGVRQGDAISPFYDPMIAKLIVWGADRKQALARMAQALEQYHIVGLHTNIAFLKRLVEGQAFASADLDTGLIERNHDTLFPTAQPAPVAALALAAKALLADERKHATDPWQQTTGWRMNQTYTRKLAFADEHAAYDTSVTYRPGGLLFTSGEESIQLGDQANRGTVLRDGDTFHVFSNGMHYQLAWNDPMAHAGETESEGGRLTAPMPGKVVAVLASKGQDVKKGDALVIMEAMKMEHTIAAPHDGTVNDILYNVGDQVADGAPLLDFQAA
ncbi:MULTISPECIES: acetyl/propionyl/methylcrotonyl-CoA carboxylase subunit alpha [unclassified Duganella]|uniref:acetyl/propionyl/methylcrotonyl-CoA carboxylase subunit alpha n=1 Tax=unclassified Duganella TaxID=2636909 RepID=UPI0008856324|nr:MULTISPECIES: acetyl/propionyl/methylcrotonyl-CoA carboxylase subunit alpha [unclassified Duganella]SDH27584.1 3-methylcrotonyl-CoA carboxylase alpha subunit [Duganella sp. OV458]SDK40195.1 3-methylcrotonoyl-CoA carboxylase, alpha subunit [Duganella sp. OV510]